MMIAQGGAELFYILAVAVIVGLSFLFERFKAVMDASRRDQQEHPRPNARRHPTALPRPEIPPLGETNPQRPRETLRPAVPRQRPPIPPPVAQPRAGGPPEIRRPGVPRRPPQTPPAPRTLEERKAVIRGEDVPQRPVRPAQQESLGRSPSSARPTPKAPPPPTPPEKEKESWARLTQLGEEVTARTAEGHTPTLGRLAQRSSEEVAHAEEMAASIRALAPADLRRAFVLKEILEPPLALRHE